MKLFNFHPFFILFLWLNDFSDQSQLSNDTILNAINKIDTNSNEYKKNLCIFGFKWKCFSKNSVGIYYILWRQSCDNNDYILRWWWWWWKKVTIMRTLQNDNRGKSTFDSTETWDNFLLYLFLSFFFKFCIFFYGISVIL